MRICRWRAALAVGLALFVAGPASGDADEPVPSAEGARPRTLTQRSVRAQRHAGERVGLDARLPHVGAYTLAIGLDAEGRFVEAMREYAAAAEELSGLSSRLLASPDQIQSWRAKLAWQRELTEELLEQDAYVAVMPTSVHAHYNLASAYHAKYLAIRAWTGRGPRELWERARAQYEATLELDGRHASARVGLARLHADAGQLDEARRHFALLGRRRDSEHLAAQVAAYHAALGETDAAFACLERAVQRPESRAWAIASNDYDPLRADPRFARIVGPAPFPVTR